MARSSLYVVIAVVCAAVTGCAATRGFADELPKLRYNIQFNYTTQSENKDSYVQLSCRAEVVSPPSTGSGEIGAGGSLSFELGIFSSLRCSLGRFDGDQVGEIDAVFWERTEKELYSTADRSYLIDDVGVYNLVQGEKKLIAEWEEVPFVPDVLASAVR